MARLSPALGEHPLWTTLLCSVGAFTMVLGAYRAYSATGIKKVLAYSTVMALGTLTMLIGIGTDHAMVAFASFLQIGRASCRERVSSAVAVVSGMLKR